MQRLIHSLCGTAVLYVVEQDGIEYCSRYLNEGTHQEIGVCPGCGASLEYAQVDGELADAPSDADPGDEQPRGVQTTCRQL
jgi:hypothetical protein